VRQEGEETTDGQGGDDTRSNQSFRMCLHKSVHSFHKEQTWTGGKRLQIQFGWADFMLSSFVFTLAKAFDFAPISLSTLRTAISHASSSASSTSQNA
jgi:hypothetical protein